jgi:hypothetical protein
VRRMRSQLTAERGIPSVLPGRWPCALVGMRAENSIEPGTNAPRMTIIAAAGSSRIWKHASKDGCAADRGRTAWNLIRARRAEDAIQPATASLPAERSASHPVRQDGLVQSATSGIRRPSTPSQMAEGPVQAASHRMDREAAKRARHLAEPCTWRYRP